MTVSILVIDDQRAIAEGFAGAFRRFSKERYDLDAKAEAISSYDEAVRRIIDKSQPPVDLVFTDISLRHETVLNKDGVAFARFARSIIPGIPLIGCSGRFEEGDLSDEERAVFDRWWPKAGLQKNLSKIAEDTLDRAIAYHESRQIVQAISENPPQTPDANKADTELRIPRTDDQFQDAGYRKTIIEPATENGLIEPFAVWRKDSQEGVELEVVGCGAIFSWGATYEDAEFGLLEVIMDLKQLLDEADDSLSPSLLEAKRFVEAVTGLRSASKGA